MIVRDNDGSYHVRTSHHAVGAGATWGMFWGFLFGLLFFIPVFGMAIGAGLGARGLDDARRAVSDLEFGAWHFRGLVDRLGLAYEALLLASSGEHDLATHLVRRNLAHLTTEGMSTTLPGGIDTRWKQLA